MADLNISSIKIEILKPETWANVVTRGREFNRACQMVLNEGKGEPARKFLDLTITPDFVNQWVSFHARFYCLCCDKYITRYYMVSFDVLKNSRIDFDTQVLELFDKFCEEALQVKCSDAQLKAGGE